MQSFDKKPEGIGIRTTGSSLIDGWKLHKICRDAESGTYMNRPGLEIMIYDTGARAFDTLLVFRVARLSRKVRVLA